jgi:ABC-type nitrate/sulfonate/bicarbonate transport system substrate-binding protein
MRAQFGICIAWMLLSACQVNKPLRLALPKQNASILGCLANEKNLWKSRKSSPELVWLEDSQDTLAMLNRGEVDLAITSLTAFVPSLEKNKNTRIVSEVFSSSRNTLVAAHKSLKLTDSKQLAGRKIGYVKGTSAEIFLEYFLLTEGVNLGGILKFPSNLDDMKAQFAEDQLDAIVLSEAELSRFKNKQSLKEVDEFRTFVHETKGVLVTSMEFVKAREDVLHEILKALIEAEDVFYSDTKQSIKIFSACLGEPFPEDLLIESMAEGRAEVKISNSLRHSYNRVKDWLILRKNISSEELPDFETIVNSKMMKDIRARAVTLGEER